MTFPQQVKIVEVSPRDGLQNETYPVPTAKKIELINLLSDTGLQVIEATSFVSPKWIPQLGDNKAVLQGIVKKPGISYPVLVPNLQGLDAALAADVKEIAVFCSPSEQFSQHNTNCSVAASIERIRVVIEKAKQHNLRIRAYISCVLGCPYEGEMAPEKVVAIAKQLLDMGCYEISLGDTIGVGTPLKTLELLKKVCDIVPINQVAVHFHDTYGQALANIYVALSVGVSIVDSSVAGIGGCPYAKGATGNVATEDVVFMLDGMHIKTGVNLTKLITAGRFIADILGKAPVSKVNLAIGETH